MTDTSVRDNLTKLGENSLSVNPAFYKDSGGLNIGYGYNITANWSTAQADLTAAGYGTDLTQAQWDEIIAVATGSVTSTAVATLNSDIGMDITETQAQTAMQNYYTNVVDPELSNQLINTVGVTSTQETAIEANTNVYAALQDLVYNANSAISASEVPNLNNDIFSAASTGDWYNVAYDISANAETAVPNRRADESEVALGLDPSTGLPLTDTSSATVIANLEGFESDLSTAAIVTDGESITPALANVQAMVRTYLHSQGIEYDNWGRPASPRTLGPAIPALQLGTQGLDLGGSRDPLVLDLNGDGVQLTDVDGSDEYFDISGDGVSSLTAWATGGDGILCTDPSNTGEVSSVSQLIGGDTGDGFGALTAFDSNSDGQITSADTDWSELRVFVPAYGSNAGGLYTLGDLGITSISLASTNTNYQISGNNITQASTFTIDGNTNAIDDVWLSYSTVNTAYTGSYTLDPDVLFLPEVRGYGDLPDLSIAMSLDGTLKGDVAALAAQDQTDALASTNDLESKIDAIMYEWAGVESVTPTALGSGLDAQQLAFMRACNDNEQCSSVLTRAA